MPLSPDRKFLFDAMFANCDDLAAQSNALLVEACVVGSDRGELLRKLNLIDAIGNYRFPADYAPVRRRLAA